LKLIILPLKKDCLLALVGTQVIKENEENGERLVERERRESLVLMEKMEK
jgi:hypothetical protein